MTNLARAVLLSLGLVVGSLPAQGEGRERGLGFVRAADGRRVADAFVVLLSRPLPSRADLGVADELRVRTGKDGMFRVDLLPGRAYSAWATWQDERGERRSQVVEGFLPGPVRAIDEAQPQQLRRVRLVDVGPWLARVPFRIVLIGGGENDAVQTLALDAEHTAVVPTLPGDHATFEVYGNDGVLLGMAGSKPLADAAIVEAIVALPPPVELHVTVVDEAGAPVAGALVQHTFGQHYRRDVATPFGVTAADGTVRGVVPSLNPLHGGKTGSFTVLVEASGRQRTIQFGDLAKSDGGKVKVMLRPGIDLIGRVLGKDGKQVPGIALLPDCYAMASDQESTGMGVPLRPVPVDAEGRFRFTSLHTKYDFRLLALLDPAAARAAGLQLRPGVAVAPVLWLAVGKPPFPAPHDLGELRLDRLTVAQVEVRAAGGAPVPGARLTVTTPDLYNSPLPYVCDRVGRLQFPLPIGEVRIGAYAPGFGVATRLVRLPLPQGEPPIDLLVLELSPTRTVRGTVVDQAGKPVAGVTVRQWNRAKCEDRALRDLSFHSHVVSAPTGADGAFELVLPLADAGFDLRAYGKVGEVNFWSEALPIAPDDDNLQRLRLVVAPWQGK